MDYSEKSLENAVAAVQGGMPFQKAMLGSTEVYRSLPKSTEESMTSRLNPKEDKPL